MGILSALRARVCVGGGGRLDAVSATPIVAPGSSGNRGPAFANPGAHFPDHNRVYLPRTPHILVDPLAAWVWIREFRNYPSLGGGERAGFALAIPHDLPDIMRRRSPIEAGPNFRALMADMGPSTLAHYKTPR